MSLLIYIFKIEIGHLFIDHCLNQVRYLFLAKKVAPKSKGFTMQLKCPYCLPPGPKKTPQPSGNYLLRMVIKSKIKLLFFKLVALIFAQILQSSGLLHDVAAHEGH